MLCKGLAQWGMRGGPQLDAQLEQVSRNHGPSSRTGRHSMKAVMLCLWILCCCIHHTHVLLHSHWFLAAACLSTLPAFLRTLVSAAGGSQSPAHAA
jgi:hypothetical protein